MSDIKTAASIVVEFGAGADEGSAIAIWDETANGVSGGSFSIDSRVVFFLIQHGNDVQIESIKSTNGTINGGKSISRGQSESLVAFTEEAPNNSLNYVPVGSLNYKFYGNVSTMNNIDKEVTATGTLPSLCDIKYSSTFKQYSLYCPNFNSMSSDKFTDAGEYPILITIKIIGV